MNNIAQNLEPLKNKLRNHSLYSSIKDVDDLKIFTDGNYLAGMVRLSINDLQNGSQPFISNNGNIIAIGI